MTNPQLKPFVLNLALISPFVIASQQISQSLCSSLGLMSTTKEITINLTSLILSVTFAIIAIYSPNNYPTKKKILKRIKRSMLMFCLTSITFYLVYFGLHLYIKGGVSLYDPLNFIITLFILFSLTLFLHFNHIFKNREKAKNKQRRHIFFIIAMIIYVMLSSIIINVVIN